MVDKIGVNLTAIRATILIFTAFKKICGLIGFPKP